jgi:predicted dehydrogenase
MSYIRRLVQDGYVGEMLACNMTLFSGGILERPAGRLWQSDKSKGANTLTIAAGHAIDGMNYAAGDFAELSSRVATTVHEWRATDTNEVAKVDSPDEIMINGVLENGALASVHVGAVPYNGSGWRLEIYGRDGTILASTNGMPQMTEVAIIGARGGAVPQAMPVPAGFVTVPEDTPRGAPRNVGQLYTRLADAIRGGEPAQPDFDHAVRMHKLIDLIQRASDEGRSVKVYVG